MVGLGAAGLEAVGRLLARGRTVVGIDAGAVGGGASGRNGGFLLAGAPRFHHRVVAEHGRELAVTLYRATLGELDRLAATFPGSVRRTGSVRIAASEDELADCREHLEAVRADGFAAEAYEGPEGRGLLLPEDAAYHPARVTAAAAGDLVRRGAWLHQHTTADGIEPGRVSTARGVVTCDVVVVAVDGGLEHVVPSLAGRVRTARAQMLATAPTAPRVTRPVYRRWGYDYWQQLGDGRLVLGGCRDLGGEDEWVHDPRPTAPVQSLLDGLLEDELAVDAPVTHRWAGSIALSDDGLPVLEAVADGIVACGAYGGTGNLLGRLAGRAAADLVLDGRSALHDLLDDRPQPLVGDPGRAGPAAPAGEEAGHA